MRILLIEDHPRMAEGIARGLRRNGLAVDICHTALEGEDLAVAGNYDAVILDLMLPDRDGLEVCRNLRRRSVNVPIMMLTALSGTEERVCGLNAGADEFLTKPFEFDDLLARLRVLLRRAEGVGQHLLRCGDLALDLAARSATRGERALDLSEPELSLLEHFMRNQGRVLTDAELADAVWEMRVERESNAVAVYVSSLRRKLAGETEPDLIRHIEGAGYSLAHCP